MLVEDKPLRQKEQARSKSDKSGISKLSLKYRRAQALYRSDSNLLKKYSYREATGFPAKNSKYHESDKNLSNLSKNGSTSRAKATKRPRFLKSNSYPKPAGYTVKHNAVADSDARRQPKTRTFAETPLKLKPARSRRIPAGSKAKTRTSSSRPGTFKASNGSYGADKGISISSILLDPFKKSMMNFKTSSAKSSQLQRRRSGNKRSQELSDSRSNKSVSQRESKRLKDKVSNRDSVTKEDRTDKKSLLTGSIQLFGPRNDSKRQGDISKRQPNSKKLHRTNKRATQSSTLLGVSLQMQLTLLVGILTIFGLAMVLSASEVSALVASHSPWVLFIKQFTYIFMGWFALAFCALRVKISTVKKLTPVIFFVTTAALLVIMIPGIGRSNYGSSRWINLGVFTFQPSELAKLATVLIGAYVLDSRNKYINDFANSTRPFLICTGLLAGLVVAQPDLGTTIVIVSIFFTLLFVARVDLKVISKLAAGAAIFGTGYALSATYRRNRLLSFISPMSQVKGPGYQVVQSLIGLHAGHIFGTGLGSSTIKWGFLPNDYTDFIFSIIGQELGLIGSLVVLCLFAYMSFLGIRVAKNARDNYQMLLASGITAWLSFQAFINIGAATGGLPVTGIPLPFLSYGGTQIITSMAAIGILVNIARQSKPRLGGSEGGSVEKETKRGNRYLVKIES